jgi:hypothetical protein
VGETLTLRGQFLAAQEPPAEQFITRLQEAFTQFQPLPTGPPQERPPVSREFLSATFMYVRHGNPTSFLEPLFGRPLSVEKSGEKVFRIKIDNKMETTTVNSLKLHLGPAVPEVVVPTKRGGDSCWPQ